MNDPVQREIPGEVRVVDDAAVQAQLDALIRDLAQVEELGSRRSQRRYNLALDQSVLGLLVEVGRLEGQLAAEETGVEAGLDLL